MKIVRSVFWFFIFLMPILGRASPPGQRSSDEQGQVEENFPGPDACGDRSSLEFRSTISFVPVKFINKREDGTLIAQFSTRTMFEQMEFKLPRKLKRGFFEMNGDWEVEISRRVFLKKFKKDFWLVSYVIDQNKDKLICEVSQFKVWQALNASFADSDNPARSLDSLAYWLDMGSKEVYFYNIKSDKAYWVFAVEADTISPNDRSETIKLDDGEHYINRALIHGGSMFKVIDHGVYVLDPHCVFNVVETKGPKIRVPVPKLPDITFGKVKMRPKPVDRNYFTGHALKSPWLCFYNKNTGTILRLVEIPNPEE